MLLLAWFSCQFTHKSRQCLHFLPTPRRNWHFQVSKLEPVHELGAGRAQAAPQSCMCGLSARAVLDVIQVLVGSLEWDLNVGLDSLEECSKIPVFVSESFPQSICINAAAVVLPLRSSCRSLCLFFERPELCLKLLFCRTDS